METFPLVEESPFTLQIETSGACNAGCHFCIYRTVAKDRVGKFMDEDLFKKIIDDATTIPRITHLVLNGLNEPLLDRRLESFISYAKRSDRFKVGIFTNGLLLTPQRADSLAAAGLDTMVVSLNSVTQEQHERIMGMHGKFSLICSHIRYAINKISLQVHAVWDDKNFTLQDAIKFYETWGDVRYGGYGLTIREGNWANEVKVPIEITGPIYGRMACMRALSQIHVSYDGLVGACCFDPLCKMVMGDLNTQTLREVYSNPQYIEFRETHSKNQADKYELCRNCSRI